MLDAEGWRARPTWEAVHAGQQAPQPDAEDNLVPDAWPHGWQYYASEVREMHFRDRQLWPTLSDSARALFRSGAGPAAGAWLFAAARFDDIKAIDDKIRELDHRMQSARTSHGPSCSIGFHL